MISTSTQKRFNLIVNPTLADFITDGDTNRVAKMANHHRFHINLVRDTTISQQTFMVTDVESGEDLTDANAA